MNKSMPEARGGARRRSGRPFLRSTVRRAARLTLILCGGVAAAAPPPPPVVVATAQRQAVIEEVPVSGTVASPRVTQLSPEVAGLVDRVLVDAGDTVSAGDALVTLDPTLARLTLEAAQAATEQVREELADARRRLADARRLGAASGIAETEIKARESEVRADAATLRLREAEQRLEQERLRRHAVHAPFDGVISRKLTESGRWVAPGDPVVELLAVAGLRIEFQVPQRYFPRLSSDTVIEVHLDALPKRALPARIGEIVPVSDPSARTFLVRVYPQQTDLPIAPGMSASGTLKLDAGEAGLVVSRDALLRHPDGRTTVWILLDGDGQTRVIERRVRTGHAFDGRVVILAGLDEDTPVVVEGNETLRQDQVVSVVGTR